MPRCQIEIVCLLIRPNIMSGLIWVQTVCKNYQQSTLKGKEVTEILIKSFIIIMIKIANGFLTYYSGSQLS